MLRRWSRGDQGLADRRRFEQSPVKIAAQELRLPVFQPVRIRAEEVVEKLRELAERIEQGIKQLRSKTRKTEDGKSRTA